MSIQIMVRKNYFRGSGGKFPGAAAAGADAAAAAAPLFSASGNLLLRFLNNSIAFVLKNVRNVSYTCIFFPYFFAHGGRNLT
jgi:hypothetical protein